MLTAAAELTSQLEGCTEDRRLRS